MNELSTAPYVIALPLLGFLIQAFLGSFIVNKLGDAKGKRLMGALATITVAASFIIVASLAYQLSLLPPMAHEQTVTIGRWIDLVGLKAPFELLIDPLSVTMGLIITGVGALIHLYATGYMSEEREYTRFFTYMNLFIASMLILVLAGNLILLFVGWEGVGLCSYLLIGFWYKDHDNSKAANKAFIVNRIGDFGFMLGLFLLGVLALQAKGAGDGRLLSFDTLSQGSANILANPGLATGAALLLFVGAMGKSAQFPLYVWLPDAMAGPTPVSALIHAATMVTSGVFLLNRMSFLYSHLPIAGAVITMVGAFTALFAALVAFGQSDIKKVLAYSTVSQLGFMFVACGAGGFSAGMFHVATHAFFKALLFLGAGAVIHAMSHNQDMRNYGRLSKYLPITCATMVIGFLAISGIPPFAGFFSKEEILRAAIGGQFAMDSGENFGLIAGYVALFSALLTGLYMARLTWLTFFGREERWRSLPVAHHNDHHDSVAEAVSSDEPIADDPNGWFGPENVQIVEEAHELSGDHSPREVPPSMSIPLVLLAVLSIVGGYALAGDRLKNWLYPAGLPSDHPVEVAWLTPAGITAGVLGAVLGILYYRGGLPKAEGFDLSKWSVFRKSAASQFGYDALVSEGTSQAGYDLARFVDSAVEEGAVEGTQKLAFYSVEGFGRILRKFQSGSSRAYALTMLVGVVALLGWVLLQSTGGSH